MKKRMLFIYLMLMASVCSAATFEISPEISHISYREKNLPFGNQVISVKEDGVFYGVRAVVEQKSKIYLALDGRYAFGTVEYSGSGHIDEIEDYLLEGRVLAGFAFKKIIIYSGYGYRYLNDDGEGKITDTGLFAYERESTYQYIPIGIKLDTKIPLQAEIDILTVGEQVSHLEKLNLSLPEIKNKQNSGVGFKISTSFKKSFERFDLVATPFLRVWKVQGSKGDDGFYEPKNTSLEVGGGIGIRF